MELKDIIFKLDYITFVDLLILNGIERDYEIDEFLREAKVNPQWN